MKNTGLVWLAVVTGCVCMQLGVVVADAETLTVLSSSPASGLSITASPADSSGDSNGSTPFIRSYASGTAVTLTAPATSGGNYMRGWSGCDSMSGTVCNVTMSANKTVTVLYDSVLHAPASPSNIIPGNGNVVLSWPSPVSATSYNIYYSTTTGVTKATGTKLANVTSPYRISGLTNGIPYYIVVTSVNGTIESDVSGQVSAIPRAPASAAYSLDDLTGTWYGNSIASGPGAPWWERATMTVASNGSFTASSQASDGDTDSPSGTFSISNTGVVTISGNTTLECRLDAGKTVMVCTDTWTSGSPGTTEMKVFTKKATSYSQADLTGTWYANGLETPGPWWSRGEFIVTADGSFTGNSSASDGPQPPFSSTFSITNDGVVTISAFASLRCVMDSGKSLLACTNTNDNGVELIIITKKAENYTQSDLAGTWGVNDLASSPGAPWWLRASLSIDANGVFSGTTVESDGNNDVMSGTFVLSSTGLVTSAINSSLQCGMNATKTVAACTATWMNEESSGTTELGIITRQATGAAKTLAGLRVTTGAGTVVGVAENSSVGYTAFAYWSDGTSSTVAPVWSVTPATYASINSNTGVLTTLEIPSNQTVTVTASYTSGGITLTASRIVIIVDLLLPGTLSTTISGSGTGTVNSITPGVAFTCASGTCSQLFGSGTSLTLQASPSVTSLFSGWSGDCSGTGSCSLTMNANHTVTALFAAIPYTRVVGGNDYGTLTDAYAAVTTGGIISAQYHEFIENLILNRPVSFLLRGGYASDFSTNNGWTTIIGVLAVNGGSVTAEKVVVK